MTAVLRFSSTDRLIAWLAVLVPPHAWGVRLLGSWFVAEYACASGALGPWLGPVTGLQVVATLIMLATAGPTVLVGWLAWGVWRRAGAEPDPLATTPFLALYGVLHSAIFLLLIVLETVAVYVVGCGT